MKLLASFFSRLYQYATVCIVVGSPLFFIPGTNFAPEVTYYITMGILVAVAIVSYVISALLTRNWHSVSRLEFIAYTVFTLAVIGSVLFAKNPQATLFGEAFNPLSAASLLSLPAIMYLVRTLPESLRQKLKYTLLIVIGVSALTFVFGLMFTGKLIDIARQLFSGFSSAVSFAAYLGLFALACLFFVRKLRLSHVYKTSIVVTAILFMAWAVALATQEGVRPNLTSTLIVGKNVLLNDGVFGIGAGNFTRAWQLYRPESVIASPYFGYDFSQGADTMSTLFVNTGAVGFLAFLLLVLTALYSTFVSYRQAHEEKEHAILGLLALTLLYFLCVSFTVPLSYAMLVVWMVVGGLGLAKARLTEYHPSKKLAFVVVPLAVLLIVNAGMSVQKTRAFSLFGQAQKKTIPQEAGPLLQKAISLYRFDGFYRTQVEYAIVSNRNLVATANPDQEALKAEYLQTAQTAVDAGLAAVKANQDNYQNYVSLGRAYELAIPFDKEGGYDRAKKSYEEAIKLYPANPYLYVMLARLEASAGTKEGVRMQLTEALKKKQNFADALYMMSQLEASESRGDEALAYAVEAVKNAPNDPLVYIQTGLLYYGKKDYQNAITALSTALEKDPNNANVAYFLALSLRDGGQPDLAKQIGDELLKRNPGNADLEAFLKSLQTAPGTAKK